MQTNFLREKMNLDTFLLYCFVSFFYIISPGPAVLLAIYNGAVNGINSVLISALGNILALLALSALSISGLSAILLASATLFTGVKFAGAGYLIYLGIKQFRSSNHLKPDKNTIDTGAPRELISYFKEGFIVAATNPKPIIFFAALFPQFLNTNKEIAPQFLIMTAVFMLFSFLSLSTYGYLGKKAKGLLSNTNSAKWFHRVSGGLFVGMGVSLFQIKNAS